jgi:hypothetical protein
VKYLEEFFYRNQAFFGVYPPSDRGNSTHAVFARFMASQLAYQAGKFCRNIVRRNINLRQNNNIMAKSRFTKRFYFLSTVFVDNFVDNEEIN